MGNLVKTVSQFDATHDPIQKSRSSTVRSALHAIERFVHLDEDMPTPNPGWYIDGATYVACFCKDHDQLGQWRAYGQGGYAIGFRTKGLQQVPALLQEVFYGDSCRDETCDEIIEYFQARPPSGHPGTHGYFDALNFCLPRLAAVKHDAFDQEVEWRLTALNYGGGGRSYPVKVRTSPRLIPYMELPFNPSCVVEIIIGPGGDFHSMRAVRALLKADSYNPDEVQITHSRAPFRG
jgi:hypothetical protein